MSPCAAELDLFHTERVTRHRTRKQAEKQLKQNTKEKKPSPWKY